MLVLLFGSLFFKSYLTTALKLYPDLSSISDNALSVHFLNVGSGDAILVRFPNNQTMIVDSGSASYQENVLFYIDNVFFKRTDGKKFVYMVVTHSDEDHMGNMLSILNTYPVTTLYRPNILASDYESEDALPSNTIVDTLVYNNFIQKVLQLSQQNSLNVITTFAGQTISINGQEMVQFLTPNVLNYSETNNYSPIMLLSYSNQKIMLTGDAEMSAEYEMINNYLLDINNLDVDVLKLGHHGSNTSTSLEFLETVKPEYIIISAGDEYNHPSPEVIDRIYSYSQANNPSLTNNILVTKEVGNVIYYINNEQPVAVTTILDAYDYLYLDYFYIVLLASGAVLVVAISASIKIKSGKATRL